MSEEQLIAAAKRNDVEAFNGLVITYQDMAYNLAYRILGDPDAAADATQDAFISAFRAVRKFRGGSFKAWLLRIVTNACYDQLRRKKRHPTVSLESFYAIPGHEEDPENYALRQELSRVIQAGIQTLPYDQRIALVLSDVQGLSYKEIAQVVGISLGTVKSRLSRARAKLRDYLLEREELLPERYRLK
ncbi:MAG: sigma-70 family RNA polymerase sigma factor [Chloroflexota bacterium]|nr:sigma-70 family RNA polymerase sigma factor [Chloroflexota bacterium]